MISCAFLQRQSFLYSYIQFMTKLRFFNFFYANKHAFRNVINGMQGNPTKADHQYSALQCMIVVILAT